MRHVSAVLFSCLLLFPLALAAESKNPADYPLRVQILGHDQTTFYHNRSLDEAKGEGRGNLFANSEVHAIDFSYECSEKLKPNLSFETYAAKWKKPGQELIVLLPVFGKSNSYWTCNLKTDVKDSAYFIQQGRMLSETPAQYKEWMVKHDYDPEHGKNTPVRTPAPPAEAGAHAQ